MAELGVNIDHVATLRQARRGHEPDPLDAAAAAERGGADGITVHLREDRRHIQDHDVRRLREAVRVKLNLELAASDEIVGIACQVRPDQATLVPERREEVTTEGGLDLVGQRAKVAAAVDKLKAQGIFVSLFLDPHPKQIEIAATLGVDAVELHTGQYALSSADTRAEFLSELINAGALVRRLGMTLHAGHGLNYENVRPVAAIIDMRELNIGHSIVSHAVIVGIEQAVREMKRLVL